MAEIDFHYSIRVLEDKWPTIFLTLSGIDQFPFSNLERERNNFKLVNYKLSLSAIYYYRSLAHSLSAMVSTNSQ